jgi:hypothetical protein
VENLKGASLGQAPALSANIRLAWRNLPGTPPIQMPSRTFNDRTNIRTNIVRAKIGRTNNFKPIKIRTLFIRRNCFR